MIPRDTDALKSQTFDLLVIGGGIFGTAAANDAAQRGLKVALIDRSDWCSATSAHSYKLVHGGLRYLQHLDFYRVRQSANARRTMIRLAPHLAHPLPIVVPTYGTGIKSLTMKGKPALRMAMTMYDTLTFDRNHGVADRSRHVPGGFTMSRDEVMSDYPGLPTEGLSGAGVFHDGQMYNPPRLVLAFARTAAKHGAAIANYISADALKRDNGTITGVEATDRLTGESFTISAKATLNAAGPYAEGLLGSDLALAKPTHWSRDAFFVVDRPLVDGNRALALPAQSHDPEAKLSRGARHLFLIPWHGSTLVGVWHKVYNGHPDAYRVTTEELQSWIDEINDAYPPVKLTLDDVSMVNAGLIPFGENHDPDSQNLKFGHRSRVIDHKATHGVDGLVTLIGVRYTTGPTEAEGAVTLAIKKAGLSAKAPSAQDTPLVGGDFDDFAKLVDQVKAALPDLDPRTAEAVAHNHGSAVGEVLALVKENPAWGQPFEGSITLEAEAVYAARSEMVGSLADVILRRTELGVASVPERSVLERCGQLVGAELGWDEAKVAEEVEACLERVPALLPTQAQRGGAEKANADVAA